MGYRRNYTLLCSYDGASFVGFQRQAPLPTVQGALEDALAVRCGQRVRIEGGGRTDAGVHARRQMITLRPRLDLDPERLPAELARHLPRGLTIVCATRSPDPFHVRFSAVNKVYRYRVWVGTTPSPWAQRYAWVLPDLQGFPSLEGRIESLDEATMRALLPSLTGWHDFGLLAHPNATGKSKRLLSRAELAVHPHPAGGALYEFQFVAPGFLRHQIRNMVGLAVTAGLGLLPPDQLARLLAGEGDRWRGARAPGRGLTLWDIQYRRGEDPFRPEGPVAEGL